MSLSSDYKRQFGWRSWARIFDALPPCHGQTVLDLGCGVGDQATELATRGARVIGVDMNEELLGEARARRIPGAEFRMGNLRTCGNLSVVADGIWCSFATAYFPDLPAMLAAWGRHLRPGGWIALTEIDDLFGHEPLSAASRALLEGYARDALLAGRYDFHMGRKLRGHLERSGFPVEQELVLEDRELAFEGPALPEVIDAWRHRLDRMQLLRSFCGPGFDSLRDELVGCLADPGHRSLAKVYCCIARSRGRGSTA